MKVEVFVLCDAATDNQGKLNFLGAFDTIFARQMPTIHPSCAVALRIRFLKIEEGNHHIKITLVDQDGKPALPSLDQKIAARMSDEVASSAVNLILNIQGLKLQKFGDYQIDLAIDNRHEASLPLTVRQIPGAEGGARE